MHIEPGYLNAVKITVANASAIGVLFYGIKLAGERFYPATLLKALGAVLTFTVFMSILSISIAGVSEIHFIGAVVLYALFGYVATLIAFPVGLLIQGFFFAPSDLVHIGVNTLSLIIPLIVLHKTLGRRFFEKKTYGIISLSKLIRLDAIYYSGVTAMVGFWLISSDVVTPLHVLSFLDLRLLITPLVSCGHCIVCRSWI
jgi:ABC-type Co2+ transport system permease subunit